MGYALPVPGQAPAQQQNKGGYKGGSKKPDWDPRAGEKDFIMARESALSAAVKAVELEQAARLAAGGVFPEEHVVARIEALTEQFYQGHIAKRSDMTRPVPASLAQQAPAAPATPAAQAPQTVPAAQPPAPAYPAPAAPAAPAYTQHSPPPGSAVATQVTQYDSLPFADHLVPFGKHATVNGVKGQPHITIAELAAGIDPGWLHWAAKKAPEGKYTDALTRAGNQGTTESFQVRVIHFLNAAEQRGTPVPEPEFRPNQ